MVHLYSRKTLMPEKQMPEKDMHVISGQSVCLFVCLFVWFDSLRPSQQFFRYVKTGLHGLNQY